MWIDTHAHLNDECFSDRVAEVLDRARRAGVERILVVGIDVESSRRAVELAEKHEMLAAVVGIQPNSLGSVGESDWDEIVRLATHARVAAIGETGLDHYWRAAPAEVQEEYFFRHLALCDRLEKPVVIHCREAEADVVRCLTTHRQGSAKSIRGVMHSFTGSDETANQCLALGLHVSFAGMVTYKKNDALRATAARIPGDRILIETDSPYLSPQPVRGKANEPAHLVHTGICLAEVRGESVAAFAAATTGNARSLFSL